VRAGLAKGPRASLRVESVPPGAAVIVGGVRRGETPITIDGLAPGSQILWLTRDGFFARAVRADAAAEGGRVEVPLEPVDAEHRFGALVDAVRQAGRERRPAAVALAAALGVDAVYVLDGGRAEPELFRRETPAPAAAPAPPERPSRVDGIDLALAGVGLVSIGVGATYLVIGDRAAEAANRAEGIVDYEREQDKAARARTIGLIAAGAGGAVLAVAVVRVARRWNRASPTVSGFLLPTGGGGITFSSRF
jgi:hypothetical protein